MLEASDSYISKMETGDKIPNVGVVVMIADFFEAELNQLLRGELDLAGGKDSRSLVRCLLYCWAGDVI